MRAALATCLLFAAACRRDDAAGSRGGVLVEDDRPAPIEAVGVSPLDFRCESVAPLDAAATALGVGLTVIEPAASPPAGTPKACVYADAKPGAGTTWTFDIDCRDRALATGEALMVELAGKPDAQPILVGRSGIDAASVLLFIDDDAPCYVRVLGPEASLRAALAHLIAERLAPRTAPGRVSFR